MCTPATAVIPARFQGQLGKLDIPFRRCIRRLPKSVRRVCVYECVVIIMINDYILYLQDSGCLYSLGLFSSTVM